MKKEFSNQEYAEKVKKLTPKFSSFSNCWHAFCIWRSDMCFGRVDPSDRV